MYIYIYIYIFIHYLRGVMPVSEKNESFPPEEELGGKTSFRSVNPYGQFSKCHVCFCDLDPGNLKFETVRTHKQHIYFEDLRRSI